MLEKNLIVELKVEKIVFGGEGLAFCDGGAVFIPDSLPGDIVKAKIISSKKTYARALIVEFVKKSEIRKEAICEHFEDCGACNLMMTDYENQLKLKKETLIEVLTKIGSLKDFEIDEIVKCEDNLNYRNKIIQPFASRDGKIVSGFYKKRTHDIIDNANCYIQPDISNKIFVKLKELIEELGIEIYNEKTNRGFLRNVMIRNNERNEYMLVLVINGKRNTQTEKITNKVIKEFPEIKSVYISINRKRTNIVLGDKNIKVYGKPYLNEEIEGIKFFIYPESFFQVNTKQAKIMYKKAIEMIDNIENKKIIDAYAGAGTITALLSKKAKFVYGIELNEQACVAAKDTFRINKIENVDFRQGKVEKEIFTLLDEKIKMDTVVFDPPRKGIPERVLRKISEAKIKEIIYISCNPSTFARDLKILNEEGYNLEKLTPVDMFPHTSHIELIAKLNKGGA